MTNFEELLFNKLGNNKKKISTFLKDCTYEEIDYMCNYKIYNLIKTNSIYKNMFLNYSRAKKLNDIYEAIARCERKIYIFKGQNIFGL